MSCPYDSWGSIVDDLDHISRLTLRWCICDAYMVIFIRIRRRTKLEFTSSLLDVAIVICIKIIYYSYDAGFLLFLAHILI